MSDAPAKRAYVKSFSSAIELTSPYTAVDDSSRRTVIRSAARYTSASGVLCVFSTGIVTPSLTPPSTGSTIASDVECTCITKLGTSSNAAWSAYL